MIEGKMIKAQFRKNFPEQKAGVLIGRVLKITEGWLMIEGKGVYEMGDNATPVKVDQDKRTIVIPRDNIAHIRVLPDSFDMDRLKMKVEGGRIMAEVEGGSVTNISEI